MPNNPKKVEERLTQTSNTWEQMAPTKTFGGLTLDQFKTGVQPSFAARDRLADLNDQITQAKNDRADADKASLALAQRVTAGVLADPTEGPNSSVYEGFGFVRKSERKSGLHRKAAGSSSGSSTPPTHS